MSNDPGIYVLTATVFVVLVSSNSWCQTADFDDLLLAPESYYNGSDGAGGFSSRRARFSNEYEATFGSWSGFSYSNVTDNTTPGFLNQYSAIAGSGAGGFGNYGVGFVSSFSPDTRIDFPSPATVHSLAMTNSTFAALSMRDGDDFAKKFGGASGSDPDFFIATIVGLDASEMTLGEVTFALADYRFADNSLDYIVDDWQTVDLSSLGDSVSSLVFQLATSDVGMFGPNTPFYFAVDDLRYRLKRVEKWRTEGFSASLNRVPEPALSGMEWVFVALLCFPAKRWRARPRGTGELLEMYAATTRA